MQRCGLQQQQALIDRHEKLTVVWDGDAAAARLAARGLSAPQLRYLTAVEEWGVRNMLTIPVAFPPESVLSPEERGVRRTEVCAKHCFHVHFPKDSFRVHFMQFVPRVALPPFSTLPHGVAVQLRPSARMHRIAHARTFRRLARLCQPACNASAAVGARERRARERATRTRAHSTAQHSTALQR